MPYRLDRLVGSFHVEVKVRSLGYYFKPEVQIFLTKTISLEDYFVQHTTSTFQNFLRSKGVYRAKIEEYLCSFKGIRRNYARDYVDLFLLEKVLQKNIVHLYISDECDWLRISFFKSRLKPILNYLKKEHPLHEYKLERKGFILVRKNLQR